MPDFVQEAQQKEKERLERLEKQRTATTEASYAPVHAPEEDEDDDIVFDCEIKKRKVEVVDLSSDEDDVSTSKDATRIKMYRMVSPLLCFHCLDQDYCYRVIIML